MKLFMNLLIHKNEFGVRPNNNGFTLLEIMIVSAIFGIVLLMSYRIFFSTNAKYKKIKTEINTMNMKNKIIKTLNYYIKDSNKILFADYKELILWYKDNNKDGISSPDEWLIINFYNNILTVKTVNNEIELLNIEDLKFYYDEPVPKTSHIIAKFKLKNTKQTFNTGITLRNENL
jgi:prepilin-type N-terminal cleavage/methylation domain-containing protein